MDVTGLLKGFRSGAISPVTYMEGVIEKSLKTQSYNHFIYQNHNWMLDDAVHAKERYATQSDRALEGVPIGIKDNIDVEGYPTTGGCPAFLGLPPSKVSCTLWSHLEKVGMINAGKTNLHELSFGTMSKNGIYGAARSALDYKRSAGGSSGGSGGAVGLGTLPIALGTDTGGSIRIPAASNGIYGYRPTIDRWPAGDFGMKLSHVRDSIGPLALSIRDIVLLDGLVTG